VVGSESVQVKAGVQGSALRVQLSPASPHGAPTIWLVQLPGPHPPSGGVGRNPQPPQSVYHLSSPRHPASAATATAIAPRKTIVRKVTTAAEANQAPAKQPPDTPDAE
jgi:hypothetical protein